MSGETEAPGWLETRLPACALYRRYWRDDPLPGNLTFWWSFGPMIGVALAVLTVSGIWLGFAYQPATGGAAISIARYTREVPFGWLIRDLHRDGATMLFLVLFVELFRGIYYGTYRNGRELVWIIGIVRLAACLWVGFLGFAMTGSPGAQSAMLAMAGHIASIPLIGGGLSRAFLGGFGLTGSTGMRMTSVHVALGFLVLLIALLGFAASRMAPAANPDGIVAEPADLAPRSAYGRKYFAAFLVFALIFAAIIGFAPGLGYPGGPVLPGALAIPAQATPPWYLLAFHGLARAGQSAGGGTFLTIAAFVLLGALPWLDRGEVASGRYRPIYAGFVLLLAIATIVLSVAAAEPAQGVWPVALVLATIWCFAHFLVVTPMVSMLERPRTPPARLSGRTV